MALVLRVILNYELTLEFPAENIYIKTPYTETLSRFDTGLDLFLKSSLGISNTHPRRRTTSLKIIE